MKYIPEEKAGYQMHIVSHTHWDREWYLTFEEFRIRLVEITIELRFLK